MRYLVIEEVLKLHDRVIAQTGSSPGIRDRGLLESAIAQPQASFGGEDLYPTIVEKAMALCFSLALNHPFVDGNKRTAHAAMEVFLLLNKFEIQASADDQEQMMLALAGGSLDRENLTVWLKQRIQPLS
jgi:death on curing protein